MQNLHTHTCYSNAFASFKDSHVFYKDYAARARELGQKVITSVEHGYQGNWPRCWEAALEDQDNNLPALKYVYGVEAYWVADRTQPDNTNAHILILARNHQGIREINKMLSIASKDGFYGKPRIDPSLMRTLTPANVLVTTACVAFWGKVNKETAAVDWHENIDALFREIYAHFGASLYLEVQAHNTRWQKMVNSRVLDLHYELGIPLIVGLDSHYIYPEQKKERQLLRDESGVKMADEDHELDEAVYEDYPDEATVIARFRLQGVLNEQEIQEAVANTDVALTFDDIILDRSRKMPKQYRGMDQQACAAEYERRLRAQFDIYAANLPADEKSRRWADLWEQEALPVIEANQSVYFLLNSDLVKLGQQKGGTYTNSGRGSAGSFFTNKMFGLTGLDRFELPVTLYPSRFMTRERLKTSLPDIDMNVSDPEPFVAAQEELMGKGHVAPMIAYGTQKAKAAFRMYARAVNLDFDLQTQVSQQIDAYERAYNNAEDEDEKETIFIEDFVSDEFLPYIEASEPFRSIVVTKSQAPCGYLLFDGDIEAEIGLVCVKSKNSKKASLCTVIDGYTADAFGYVKNDILTVTVAAVNAIASEKAGLPYLSAEELIARTKDDSATWDIFAHGYTLGVNQCQGASTIDKLMRYKPRSLQDMSAFAAAIRPGFKSMVQKFLGREQFSYDIPAFDALLKNDSTGSSWLLYQEDVMKVLGLADFPMDETYPIIKAISKKKVKVINAAKIRFIDGFNAYQKSQDESISDQAAQENSETVWQFLYDSSRYSFNASHAVAVALDAIYGAYLKAHYPHEYYSTLLDIYTGKGDKNKVATIKAEMLRAFDIRVAPCQFRQDNRKFSYNKAANTISDALPSIRGLSMAVAEELYSMRGDVFFSFTDLLHDLEYRPAFRTDNTDTLIRMGYFSEFGLNGKLLDVFTAFKEGKDICFKKTYVEATRTKRLAALNAFEQECEDRAISLPEQLSFEAVYYGSPISRFPDAARTYVVLEAETKYSPKLTMYSAVTGKTGVVKVLKKYFAEQPLEPGDVIIYGSYREKPKYSYKDGERVKIPGQTEFWMEDYVLLYRPPKKEAAEGKSAKKKTA